MHPQLAAALSRLDAAGDDFRACVECVPPALRGQTPAPGRWSVNEVAEHIGKVEQIFVGALIAKIETARASGLGPEIDQPAMLPELTTNVVIDRSTPRIAPEPAQPTGNVDALVSLQTIDDGHQRLKGVLRSAEGLALSTVTHDHRFFGTLNVYQWVDLIAGHERRHASQLREIAVQVGCA